MVKKWVHSCLLRPIEVLLGGAATRQWRKSAAQLLGDSDAFLNWARVSGVAPEQLKSHRNSLLTLGLALQNNSQRR